MKRLALAGLASLLATSIPAQAIPLSDSLELTLTAEAVSDYRSRGQSQTLGDPALQASATLAHDSGLYLGAWASNVDFGNDLKTRLEVDYYAGYFWQIHDEVSLDLGYVKYAYSKEGQLNYAESYAILSAYGVQLGHQYASDYAGDQAYSWSYLGYETSLPADIGLALRYGLVDYKDELLVSRSGSTRSTYNEWEVKLTKDFIGATWGIAYVDTDMSKAECDNFLGYDDLCDATAVASVSKSF